jgi:hypothetical protein
MKLVILLLNIFILFCATSLSQNFTNKLQLHFVKEYKVNDPDDFEADLSLQKDTLSIYGNYISLSVGLSTYKPIYYMAYEGNIYFHMSQGVYLMTGLIYFDNVRNSSPDITIQYDLFANLYLLKKWQINKLFTIWGGVGVTPSFGYSSANLFFKYDIAINNSSNIGLYLKQQFLINKKAPNYLRSAVLLLHYSIKL